MNDTVLARPITDAVHDIHNGYVPHDFHLEGTFDMLHDMLDHLKDNQTALHDLDTAVRSAILDVLMQEDVPAKEMVALTHARRERRQYYHTELRTVPVEHSDVVA